MHNEIIQKIIEFFKTEITAPQPYGLYHFGWILATIFIILILYKTRENHSETKFKIVVGTYVFIELILEIIKQIAYSVDIDSTGLITWDYRWQAFPLQLCSTPMIIGLIVLFMKKSEKRSNLLTYISYLTILGSIVTVMFPWQCLSSIMFVSIHTMWLHCGSLVLSLFFIFTNEVEISLSAWKKSIPTFLFFVTIANTLNIIIYNLNVLDNGERFDMFYISPYFTSTL